MKAFLLTANYSERLIGEGEAAYSSCKIAGKKSCINVSLLNMYNE